MYSRLSGHSTNKSRGFAFVTFTDFESPQIVLRQDHIIDEKAVDVKPAKPKVLTVLLLCAIR